MIEGVPISVLSASALLGLAVLLLLTGRLVPRVSLQDKQKECDNWRLAFERERDARALSDRQTTELLEIAKTTHAVISAMYASANDIRQGGDDALSQER